MSEDKTAPTQTAEEKALHADRLRKLGAVASVSVAITLAFAKIIATIMTGSLALMSSMVDSLADIAASGITMLSVRLSTRPPTEKLRYGMGKAEALSALGQSAFIGGSGVFIVFDIIDRLFNPKDVEAGGVGIGVMIFSLALTLGLVFFQNYVIKTTGSMAIEADSANYKGDLVTNGSIIFALCMVEFFDWHWFDLVAAAGVAFYLLRNAAIIGWGAIKLLMDHELPLDVRNKASEIIKNHDFVKGVHDLRTRDLGNGEQFEFHLELDANISLKKAHDLAHIVEEKLMEEFPKAQVIIHQEPEGLIDHRLDNVIVATK